MTNGIELWKKTTEETPLMPGNPPAFDDPKYRAALNADVTDEQATEFLRALDFILRSFVEMGFGVDSVQRIFPPLAEFSSQEESSEVKQVDPQSQFNESAAQQPEKGEE